MIKLKQILFERSEVSFKMDLPQDLLNIKDIFQKNSYQLYVVGGAVRDALLGKTPKDYDLVTNALPDDVIRILKDKYKIVETGKAFNIINVITSVDEYEIATFRTDIGKGRRPTGVEFATIDQDANRRDLTINALFYDINSQKIIDFHTGISDLKNNIIQTVGNASERFDEDPLRKLRAIRFAGRTRSNVSPEISNALKKDNTLNGVSTDRIQDEFIKGIRTSKDAKFYLNLLNTYKLFDSIFPGININERYFVNNRDVLIVISSILRDEEISSVKDLLIKMRYNNIQINAIIFLISLHKLNANNSPVIKKLFKKTKLTNGQIKKYAEIVGISEKLINALIKLISFNISGNKLKTKGFSGIEIGNEINRREIEFFKEQLK